MFNSDTGDKLTLMGYTKSLNHCANLKVSCDIQNVSFYKIETSTRKYEYIFLNENDIINIKNVRINPKGIQPSNITPSTPPFNPSTNTM